MMLPRWHILIGAIFSILFWFVFPETSWIYISLIFLSSVLIDFDHYTAAVWNTKKLGLFEAFRYYKLVERQEKAEQKRRIFRRGNFHFIHTVEFHAFVLFLGLAWTPFIYVLIGMVIHSIIDIIEMAYLRRLYRREFSLINWLAKNL